MKGQAFIKYQDEDDTKYRDLYETYRVTLTRGWREALLKPAAVKDYSKNDSRLEDGIRIIAKKEYAKKKKRDIQLPFILEAESETQYLANYEKFLNDIAYSGMIYLKVPVMNKVFKVVYTDCQKFGDFGLKKGNFTLKLTEPNPADRD
jgi:hypothetical protein